MTDMTIFTKQLRRFFEDASAAEYKVEIKGTFCPGLGTPGAPAEETYGHSIDIYKKRGKKIDIGVKVYTVDGRFGSANRIDVDPNLALKIETIKRCREILGI